MNTVLKFITNCELHIDESTTSITDAEEAIDHYVEY